MSEVTRYPLAWPAFWPRTPAHKVGRAKFHKATRYPGGNITYGDLSLGDGLDRLIRELKRLGAADVLVSTNARSSSTGLPYRDSANPKDPAVAVYFKLKGKPRVLACDRWHRLTDNLAAIAAHIECLRGIERYGVGTLDQAFTAYDALPAPGAISKPHWRKVLGFSDSEHVTERLIRDRFKVLAKDMHPDRSTGGHEAMSVLNVARDEALTEVGAFDG